MPAPLRRTAAAFLMTLAFAACLALCLPSIGALSFVYISGVLAAYIQCLPLLMLFIAALMLPPCFSGRSILRAMTLVALGLAPFATWEWNSRGNMLLTAYAVAALLAALLAICALAQYLARNLPRLPLPRWFLFIAKLVYWLCFGGIVAPMLLIVYSFAKLVRNNNMPYFRPEDIWHAENSIGHLPFGVILPIILILLVFTCGFWTYSEYKRLKYAGTKR